MGMRGRVGTPTALALYSTLSPSRSHSRFLSTYFSLCLSQSFLPFPPYVFAVSFSFSPVNFVSPLCLSAFRSIFSFSLFVYLSLQSRISALSILLSLLHICSFRSDFCIAARFSTGYLFRPACLIYLSLSCFHFSPFPARTVRAPSFSLFAVFSLGAVRLSLNIVFLFSFQFVCFTFTHLP